MAASLEPKFLDLLRTTWSEVNLQLQMNDRAAYAGFGADAMGSGIRNLFAANITQAWLDRLTFPELKVYWRSPTDGIVQRWRIGTTLVLISSVRPTRPYWWRCPSSGLQYETNRHVEYTRLAPILAGRGNPAIPDITDVLVVGLDIAQRFIAATPAAPPVVLSINNVIIARPLAVQRGVMREWSSDSGRLPITGTAQVERIYGAPIPAAALKLFSNVS